MSAGLVARQRGVAPLLSGRVWPRIFWRKSWSLLGVFADAERGHTLPVPAHVAIVSRSPDPRRSPRQATTSPGDLKAETRIGLGVDSLILNLAGPGRRMRGLAMRRVADRSAMWQAGVEDLIHARRSSDDSDDPGQ